MIERVQISGYKTFNDFEQSLTPLTVIFGPNAAGKSNFLDALQLFSRMATSKTIKDAFEPPYRGRPIESFSFSETGIDGLIEKNSLDFTISADIRLSDSVITSVNRDILNMRKGIETNNGSQRTRFITEPLLRYLLEIEFMPKEGFLRVKNERLCALKKDYTPKNRAFLEINDQNRLSLRMEGQAHPTFYDIGLNHTILSLPLYPPHYPHLYAVKQELSLWQFFYFEPRERMRAANPTREITHLGMMGEDLAAFLNTLKVKDSPRFQAIERALRALIPSIDRLETEINKNTGEVELMVYEQGVPISSRLVSEGTSRILGLLAIGGGHERPPVICFEEPENGIHPKRISLIAEYLKNIASSGSQIIVTTHSPILLDLIDNSSLYVVRKENRTTHIIRFGDTGLFRKSGIEQALEDEEIALSDMLIRGDLDA